jgi:FecR protein
MPVRFLHSRFDARLILALSMFRRISFTRALHTLLASAAVLVSLRPVHAQSDAKAVAVYLTGDVAFIKDSTNARMALFQGGTVGAGQLIVTGHDGYAKFQVKDGSTFEVFPDSRVFFRSTTNFEDLLNVVLGKVKVFIQHLPNIPNPNNVITPTALISVRGTEFLVNVVDDEGTTEVSVDEGVVNVRNLKMGGQIVTLIPGQATRVDPHAPLVGLGNVKGGVFYRIVKAGEDLLYQGIPGVGPRGPSGTAGGTTSTGAQQGDKGKPTTTGTGTGSPTGGTGTGSPTGGSGNPPPNPGGGGGD